jgi:hypothetical protein
VGGERVLGDGYDRNTFYMYENSIMKLTKSCFKKEKCGDEGGELTKRNRRGEFGQSPLYTCMEISQNFCVQLIYLH